MMKKTFVAVLVTGFLGLSGLVVDSAQAGPRASRKFGISLEGFNGGYGVFGVNYNFAEQFRGQLGFGTAGSGSFRAFKAGFKWLPMADVFSVFLGAEYWAISGSVSGITFTAASPAVTGGIDVTTTGGFNIGAGLAVFVSGGTAPFLYIGYYF